MSLAVTIGNYTDHQSNWFWKFSCGVQCEPWTWLNNENKMMNLKLKRRSALQRRTWFESWYCFGINSFCKISLRCEISAEIYIVVFISLSFFPVSVNVYVPKDRVTNLHQGYGFVEFRSEEDADYVSVAHGLWSKSL